MKLKSLSELNRLLPTPPTPSDEHGSKEHDGKGKHVRISLDTKGRKGKTVTIVSGLQHNPATMKEIAAILKRHCGAGGTVKGNVIEIQGDQRGMVKGKLVEMHYRIAE